MERQRVTGYGRRNAAETAVGQYKRLIGPRLRARNAVTQAGEVALAVQVLNRMIREVKPVTVRRTCRNQVRAPAPSGTRACVSDGSPQGRDAPPAWLGAKLDVAAPKGRRPASNLRG